MARRKEKVGIPEARVVLGKHAPSWAHRRGGFSRAASPARPGSVTYERATSYGSVTLLMGLWPLFAVALMGIALLWTGTVYGTP